MIPRFILVAVLAMSPVRPLLAAESPRPTASEVLLSATALPREEYVYEAVREIIYSRRLVDDATKLGLDLAATEPVVAQHLWDYVLREERDRVALLIQSEATRRDHALSDLQANIHELLRFLGSRAVPEKIQTWRAEKERLFQMLSGELAASDKSSRSTP